jgi:EmrB/QacA subfamily drug resistance transporter
VERRWKVLILVFAGAFVAYLDVTIVNIAFPDIVQSFPSASRPQLSWILNGYNIAFAALLLPCGRLADRIGRRRVFLGGLILFTCASIAAATASSSTELIAARVVQGMGSAALIPASLAFILAEFPPGQRATGVGLLGAAAGVSAGIGPSLGGLLVSLDSWRLVFLVNIPVGMCVVFYGLRILDRGPRGRGPMPDFLGAVLVTGAMGALTLAIVQGPIWGWGSARTLGTFAIAGVLVAAFIWRSAHHPAPVIALSLFRDRALSVATVGTLLFSAGLYGMLLNNVLFLTVVWHYSILSAGLATSPAPLTAAVVAGPAGRLTDRFGQRIVATPGAALFALGNIWYATRVGASPDFLADWLPGALLAGAGVGLGYPALASAALACLPAGAFAAGSAVNAVSRQIGAALGVSILIAVIGTPVLAHALDAAENGWTFSAICGVAALLACLGVGRVRTHVEDQVLEVSR